MSIKGNKKKKLKFAKFGISYYNKNNRITESNTKYTQKCNMEIEARKEGDKVTKVLKALNKITLPPHQMKALGLKEGWQKKVSDKDVARILDLAEGRKKTLKELAKY